MSSSTCTHGALITTWCSMMAEAKVEIRMAHQDDGSDYAPLKGWVVDVLNPLDSEFTVMGYGAKRETALRGAARKLRKLADECEAMIDG